MLNQLLQRYWRQISLSLLIITIILSLLPTEDLPPTLGTDKSHHLIAYMSIAFPIAVVQARHWQKYLILIIVISGIVELIQPLVNRYAEWLDLLANSIGVLLAIILAAIYRQFFMK